MAAKEPVPYYNSLDDIYPSKAGVLRESRRWNGLATSFEERYGTLPSHIIRAPGRLNVLGEHIDYSLFPVLPAAIEQDILIALLPTVTPCCSESSNPIVKVANLDDSAFSSSIFQLNPPNTGRDTWCLGFIPPKQGGGWENYLKASIMECLERFFPCKTLESRRPKGMNLLVSGTVPPGSGLSSSAAFVVAGVLTFLIANDIMDGLTKGDVVEMAIASEHRMGVRTGGMDQSASVLGLSNSLLHLSFYPNLHPVPLPLPPSLAIVIANSLTPHALASSAPEQYNLRVVEMLCATRLLIHAWGLDDRPELSDKVSSKTRVVLREALELWSGGQGGKEEGFEQREIELFKRALKEIEHVLGKGERRDGGWTKEEMIIASGMSEDEFTETYLDFLEVRATHFHLYRRVYHTLDESIRVLKFRQICHDISKSPEIINRSLEPSHRFNKSNEDKENQDPNKIVNGTSRNKVKQLTTLGNQIICASELDPRFLKLGKLISASHMSCQEVYECTHPLVDECKEICQASGSLGSRMTGGGWGGAVISLVPVDKVSEFMEIVKKDYRLYQGLSEEELNEAVFATLPGSGAGVYVL